MVRVKIFCLLHDRFDVEGAGHANLENKHDLVIKSHYKLMFAFKKKKIPLSLFFSTSAASPFFLYNRALHVHVSLFGRKNAVSG